jgi:hypothetical protein
MYLSTIVIAEYWLKGSFEALLPLTLSDPPKQRRRTFCNARRYRPYPMLLFSLR